MENPYDAMRNTEPISEDDAVMKKESASSGPEDRRENSRRSFLTESVRLVAGVAAAQVLPGRGAAQQKTANAATLESLTNAKERPILLKDGIVLSMDRQAGDFQKADVLIQGKKILAVGSNLSAPAQAVVVNALGMIVMPGFVDTHHHQFETPLRSILSDGLLGGAGDTVSSYQKTIIGTFTPAYLPEDARIGELVASLSQINAGVTTTVDTSQVSLTPEHTDACIAGLKESGRRVLFAYSAGQGAKSSLATAIAMLMRHGMPPVQPALDNGIRPSLSVDVECNMTADMFSIMRAAYTLQRALINQRALTGEQNLPPLVTCRDVIEF